jgi:hypothetical protein
MDFNILIIISIVFLVIFLVNKMDQRMAEKHSEKEIKEKNCPPHKWRYEDQPGMENVCFLRCQLCKKTPQEVNEGK